MWNLGQQKQKFGKNYVEFIRELPAGTPGRVRYEAWQKEAGPSGDAAFLVLIARELYTTTAAAYREFAGPAAVRRALQHHPPRTAGDHRRVRQGGGCPFLPAV